MLGAFEGRAPNASLRQRFDSGKSGHTSMKAGLWEGLVFFVFFLREILLMHLETSIILCVTLNVI